MVEPTRRKPSKLGRLPTGFILITVLPALVLTVVFIVWPTVNALTTSLTNAANATAPAAYVGLKNYIKLFTNDKNFGLALGNTLKLLAVVPVVTISLSLLFAFVFTQSKLRERGLYRVLYFMPSILSMTVIAVVWAMVFDPRKEGIANIIVSLFGGKPVAWFGSPKYALWCIAFVLVWQAVGYYMVMHVAALDGISKDIYEAASIDGAGPSAKFFRITIPLLRDTIGITFVLSMSGTINLSFALSNIMSGTTNYTYVLIQHIYRMAFGSVASFGYAMAVTVFVLAMAVLLSVLSRRLSYRNENIQGG